MKQAGPLYLSERQRSHATSFAFLLLLFNVVMLRSAAACIQGPAKSQIGSGESPQGGGGGEQGRVLNWAYREV